MKFKKVITVFLVAIIALSALSVMAFAENRTGVVYGAAPDPLRVRTGPGTKEAQLTYNGSTVYLYDGNRVTVLREVDSVTQPTSFPKWYEISFEYSGKTLTGFVAKSYIKLDEDKPTEPPIEQNIPDIYKSYLAQVQSVRPNWKFEFYDTGLDWKTVIDNEDVLGRSLITGSRPLSYRSKMAGAYDPATNTWISLDAGGWYQANRQVLGYYIDPRNFMSESQLFQFELLSYDKNTHVIDGVNSLLKGSFMQGKTIFDGEKYITYAEAFMKAAEITGVSPYHLASRVIQEVGNNGSGSTSGTNSKYPGIYNYYNINANQGSDPITNGLKWASETNADSSKNYMRPWNTPYKSIVGGAMWILGGYISTGQNTMYFQKFDVIDDPSNGLFWHQYMGNIEAPKNESGRIYKKYSELSALSTPFVFRIPLYNNMPSSPVQLPGSAVKGDVNCDGSVGIADSMLLFQYVAGKISSNAISDTGKEAADVNGDNEITIADSMKLFQYVAGKISSL